jgi:hypothetical protein
MIKDYTFPVVVTLKIYARNYLVVLMLLNTILIRLLKRSTNSLIFNLILTKIKQFHAVNISENALKKMQNTKANAANAIGVGREPIATKLSVILTVGYLPFQVVLMVFVLLLINVYVQKDGQRNSVMWEYVKTV